MIYNNILSAIFGNHWYVSAEYMGAVLQMADNIFTGHKAFDQLDSIHDYIEQEARIEGSHQLGRVGTRGTEVQLLDNGTAVIPISGVIAPKISAIGMSMAGTSMEMLAKRSRELKVNSDVTRVVLNINSGGGTVLGVPEAARAIRELATVKPVTAYFNFIGASAAYFLAAAAGKRVVTDSSIIGSIGVYTIVATQAKRLKKVGIDARIIRRGAFKAMPNSLEPFADQEAGLALVDKDVEGHYRVFVNAIQNYLGISMSQAEKLADGSVSTGQAGIDKGLADEMGTLADVLAGDIQAEVIENTPTIAVDVPEKTPEATLEPPTAEVDEVVPVASDETEVAKLQLQVALLTSKVEQQDKQAEANAEEVEKAKILALVETAVKDERIAPMKADAITVLANKVGLEAFTEMLAAMPKGRAQEDLSTAPADKRSENPFVAANKLDDNAPTTEAEVELFRNIPTLKARYGL